MEKISNYFSYTDSDEMCHNTAHGQDRHHHSAGCASKVCEYHSKGDHLL